MGATLGAWSWSRYAVYKQCPAKFNYKFIKKLPDEGSSAMERGNLIHKLAENYVTGELKKLPPELKNFADEFKQLRDIKPMVEQEWGFKSDWSWTGRQGWFGNDVWFRAKADVFAAYEDNTADIIDHKTGKKYDTNKEQVELFVLSGFKRLPTLTHITARLWYLDQANDNEVIMEYTAQDAALLQKDWDKKVKPMFADQKFPPKPNDKCRWCNYGKNRGGPCKF